MKGRKGGGQGEREEKPSRAASILYCSRLRLDGGTVASVAERHCLFTCFHNVTCEPGVSN